MKICHSNWFGPSCTTFCKNTDDDSGHYLCNETSGSKICRARWYGNNCDKLCKEDIFQNSCKNVEGIYSSSLFSINSLLGHCGLFYSMHV
jgi:hypothetical protein